MQPIIYLYYMCYLSPYLFRALTGPSSGVSWAACLCYHLFHAVLLSVRASADSGLVENLKFILVLLTRRSSSFSSDCDRDNQLLCLNAQPVLPVSHLCAYACIVSSIHRPIITTSICCMTFKSPYFFISYLASHSETFTLFNCFVPLVTALYRVQEKNDRGNGTRGCLCNKSI
jgi:hypothetical protein